MFSSMGFVLTRMEPWCIPGVSRPPALGVWTFTGPAGKSQTLPLLAAGAISSWIPARLHHDTSLLNKMVVK